MRQSPTRTSALLAVAVVVLAAAPGSLGAQFQGLQTPTMRLIYTSPAQSYLVPQVVTTFDRALRFHEKLFGYNPGKTNVLMHDLWHYGNAGGVRSPRTT